MIARPVLCEFAKMRRLRTGIIAGVMIVGVLALALFALASSPDRDTRSPASWDALLAGASLGVPLLCPLLLAVLASRQTDIEHRGNGWLLGAASGITPGTMCRAKLVAVGTVVVAATVGVSLGILACGRMVVGIDACAPLRHWVGFTLCMAVVNLAVLAVHVLLAARVENQLVVLGIGVLGCVVAVFSQGLPAVAAHMTPWGYYSLARAAGYEDDVIRSLPIDYSSIAALGLVTTVVFAVVTTRYDRREA
ncbi:ABC transporter permease [Tsukamurella asaccharolytica]|uniref:ABC transporter permease n=1 Tax=Tsukamurella asaccharolytica TaxID=2592067 RepID=A0A5C5R928_9ACTN|nr:ABC transporter permease [Tsukamurella asaccharolytica]TWS18691.1 ABC transporter permease [Tsukamurella asaccharolytica]